MTVDSIDDGVFGHDEVDITIISYMLQAADDGCHVVRVLSDDTDIFVCLSTGHGAVVYRIVSPSRWCCPKCQCHMRTIRLFANDVIIIGSVRADWPAPINVTIGNPRADKLGRNGFECIGRRCYVDREIM